MQNRYKGVCRCGTEVDSGAGTVTRVEGKWIVSCATCSTTAAVPLREMNGMIMWPSGGGATECTTKYEDAVHAEWAANAALMAIGGEAMGQKHPDFARLYNEYHAAVDKVGQLQAEGGHMGLRVRFDKVDPLLAAIGHAVGGRA